MDRQGWRVRALVVGGMLSVGLGPPTVVAAAQQHIILVKKWEVGGAR